jgi:hypothetical protein
LPGKDGRYYFQLFQWDAAKPGFFLITGVIDRVHWLGRLPSKFHGTRVGTRFFIFSI